ncbi:redox-sensitive transcriptional activator SoxR [Halobacteriovorax marinus]|uniref:redox-sensitive transcriptional activator SoxR n=1 Tax=Halobacteriovorax marinus TaxID=97084 RepID=UPI000BC2F479|nr:redox-sensitive transcriptional activator SoxR [Halobacteriovorax marinus]ATH06807.1 redox-sensitive transcriptional activator SoxR [Halobacteriovorax marinus]
MSRIKQEKEILSVGELSERSGVTISAIHFYESKGLLRSTRSSGNQRRFHRRELRVLGYIKVAQKIGLSLEEIKYAFKSIVNKERPTVNDWKKLGKSWDEVLSKRMELIIKMKSQLGYCIGCGCLSLKDCPLRNEGDFLAAEGSGPRLLLDDN